MMNPNIQLWSEDEVHFQRHTSITRMWSPKGCQPQIISASTREKVGFFGALNVKTGQLITRKTAVFNATTFEDFLQYLLQQTEGKLLLILDNATWHRARDLKGFFLDNQDRLVRVFLPPYSPEL
ncbi:MAG TPA: transposase [Candidatus Marinimicrobia bacterium]|nr:transposase [Candidatus Neomarinimicrobiota bacterium]